MGKVLFLDFWDFGFLGFWVFGYFVFFLLVIYYNNIEVKVYRKLRHTIFPKYPKSQNAKIDWLL